MGSGKKASADIDDTSESVKPGWFGGASPFSGGSNSKKDGKGKKKGVGNKAKISGVEAEMDRSHWLLREKILDETSLPPNIVVQSNNGTNRSSNHSGMLVTAPYDSVFVQLSGKNIMFLYVTTPYSHFILC